MKIIVCISNNNGMMFNARRQSQDRVARDKIKEYVGSHKLYMNKYSSMQFEPLESNILVEDEPMKIAKDEDYVFVENIPLELYADAINEIILLKWNRDYPADQFFKLDLSGYKKTGEEEFKGHSHEKITMEVFKKNV